MIPRLFLFWRGSNQIFFGYVCVQLWKTVSLTEGPVAACCCSVPEGSKINDKTSLQTRHIWLFFTVKPPVAYRKTPSSRLGQADSNPSRRPRARGGSSCFLSTVFGLVQYLVVFSFKVSLFNSLFLAFCVSFFFLLPRQSVSLSNKNLEAKFSQYFFQPPDKNL